MTTVSERVAETPTGHVDEFLALMGNGNAYFIDALSRGGARVTAMRHEMATVAAADAYFRVARRPAMVEAAPANTPLVLVGGG